MTLCERYDEEMCLPWGTILKVAGVAGVWVIAYLLWRRR